MKEKQNRYTLSFSNEDLTNSRIRNIIRELVEIRLYTQKYKDFIEICPAEFEIVRKFSEFVPKEKYNSQTTFKGEMGKIRGKKLIVS